MPAYNAGNYIGEAIESVIKQVHTNWELLIINDGSRDNTEDVVLQYDDARIKYFKQKNSGVSIARNLALEQMQGDFFCFLDADDILPPQSLSHRVKKFSSNPKVSFIDGEVVAMDANLRNVQRHYRPSFRGCPQAQLKQLSESCFYGITWMVRRNSNSKYCFNSDAKYAEDLLFYLSIADQGIYDYVDAVVYINRKVESSAMHNLKALAKGYRSLLRHLVKNYQYSFKEKLQLIIKIRVLILKLLIKHYLDGKKAFINLCLL